MRKFFYLILFAAFFINNAHAVDDCIIEQESKSILLVLTEHTVVFPVPKLCKPLPIAGFTAKKLANSWDYSLDWSKQNHDLWHVGNYEVRINGNDNRIVSFDYDQQTPVNLDLNSGASEGILHQFEVRACSSVPSDDPLNPKAGCGDWQSTQTQCEAECTDSNLIPPTISSSVSVSTTGNFTVNWTSNGYSNFNLQQWLNNGWTTVYSGQDTSKSFSLPNENGSSLLYRVRGCSNNICSNFSDYIQVDVALTPTPKPVITDPEPSNTTGTYTVRWTESNYTSKYYLEEKVNQGPWTVIQDNANIEKLITHTDGIYSYRVKACNLLDSNCSGYSTVRTVTVNTNTNPQAPQTPTGLTVPTGVNTTGQYRVSWNASTHATTYKLLETTNGQSTEINAGNNTSYDFGNQQSGYYTYQVKACNNLDQCSAYSASSSSVEVERPLSLSDTPAGNTAPAAEPDSAIVGSMNGSYQTDQMGQASYSVPIFAGMGTAGLSPKVSLNYSSGSGNGPLGVGWSVSGVTVITRCRETEESRDGNNSITPKPITWGAEDRLCLNGERLFLSTGSEYWSDGSTYRTERDQFARITYIDSSESFTIERKDGSIAYYGDTPDSNIQATDVTGSPTYAWAISRFQDNMSNYIDYSYNNGVNAGQLEFVLTDIDFTGHIADSNNPSDVDIAPYNNIHFTYDSTRDDKTTTYMGGAKVEMQLRLTKVESKIDGSIVRSYDLNYDYSSTTSRSIIKSMEECRGNNCFPATIFSWSEPKKTFNDELPSGPDFPSSIGSSKFGDVNGDGRTDLIYIDDSRKFKVALANGNSGFNIELTSSISASDDPAYGNKWQLLDYNADGKTDLLRQSNGNIYVNLANGSSEGFSSSAVNLGFGSHNGGDIVVADVNGDGLSDLLYTTFLPTTELSVRFMEKSGSTYSFSDTVLPIDLPTNHSQIDGINAPSDEQAVFHHLSYSFYDSNNANVRTQDVNGDGVADLILRTIAWQEDDPQTQVNTEPYEFISPGVLRQPPPDVTSYGVYWIAFIGNGLMQKTIDGELINVMDYSTENQYILSIGASLTPDKNIRFVDINADGLTDVLAKNNDTSWKYSLGTGTEFTSFQTTGSVSNSDHVQVFDYNGDSYIDLLFPTEATGSHPYLLRKWTGNGFSVSAIDTGVEAIDLDTNANIFIDLNGDGREDHLRIDNLLKQNIQIRKDSYKPVDKITTFTNGLDVQTEVYYEPLTFSSVYFRGVDAIEKDYGNGSPVFDYLSNMHVVRSVITDAPTELDPFNTTGISYHYKSARVQSGGRGFLGFETITTSVPVKSSNDNTNYLLETQTTYHQDFPYIGFPESVTVTQYEVLYSYPTNCNPNAQNDCFPDPCIPEPTGECIDPFVNSTSRILSQTINTVDSFPTVGKSVFAYIDTTTEQTWDPVLVSDHDNNPSTPQQPVLLKTRHQSTIHDNYGNPKTNTVKVFAGNISTNNLLHTTTTINDYTNQSSNWKIGLLESTNVSVDRPGQPLVSSLMEYDYNYTTGMLKEERKNVGQGQSLFLRILHEYDNFGNEEKTISCSSDLTRTQCANTGSMQSADISAPYHVHRYNKLDFDFKGRYVNSIENSLGQTVSTVNSRNIYGSPKSTTNNLVGTTTTNTYDAFGAAITSYSSLGTWTYTSKRLCSDIDDDIANGIVIELYKQCPDNAHIRITNKTHGGSVSYSFVDKLSRTVSTREQSFNTTDTAISSDNRWVVNETYYDALGRSNKSVGPYFFGETNNALKPVTTTEYDRYNRVTKVILPDNNTESISYEGFKTTTTNALGQTKKEIKNALGELVKVKDNIGSKLNYTYNSQGLVIQIKRTIDDPDSEDDIVELLMDNQYDIAGRKTTSKSVDTGTVVSVYNAEGEIIQVTDNKNQKIKTYRDTLGRVYLTETFESDGTKEKSINYFFNSTTNLLSYETDFSSAEAYKRSYAYDTYNRLESVTVEFNDSENICNQGDKCRFTTYNYYDQFSRSKYEIDASGKGIENIYNNKGFLSHVRNKDNTSQRYYKILETDARGNITSDTKSDALFTDYSYDVNRGFMTNINTNIIGISNRYQYDALGNIKKRSTATKAECFFYDGLNRLTDTYRFKSNNASICTNPSGFVEQTNMQYDGRGNITQKDGQTYSYDTALEDAIDSTWSDNSPHQVRTKDSQSFTYDANGNNTQTTSFKRPNNTFATRNIEYTTFDKIKRVYLGNTNSPLEEANYKYDTSNNRYARIDTDSSGNKKVTYFIGSTEIEFKNGLPAKYKRHLGNYAIVEEFNGISTDRYLFTDHLGSVDKITDASGAVIQDMSFSAWGERRDPDSWNLGVLPTVLDQLSDYTNRGFTGHEMVDAFGIINMGGRIYDAALGRMLQSDPFVQDPTNTQSFNRYTYVFNNPLSYTDPSGYFSLRQAIGIVAGIVVGIVLGPAGIGIANTYWAAFVGGFTSGAIITGSLKGALISGLTAMATAAITNNIFEFIKGDPSTGLKASAQTMTEKTTEAMTAPLANGTLSEVSASAKALTDSVIKSSVQAVAEVGESISVGLETITVAGDAFREALLREIERTIMETWAAAQVAYSGQKSVSLGQANINGSTYDMSMNLPASNMDRWIAGGVAVIAVATAVTQVGRNFVKKTFGAAKGKVQDLFKKFKRNYHKHHSDPKFMGGDPKQQLTKLVDKNHRNLHNDMNKFLRQQTDEFGNHMHPVRGNSGATIRNNFTRAQRLNALAKFYRGPGAIYKQAAKDFFSLHPGL